MTTPMDAELLRAGRAYFFFEWAKSDLNRFDLVLDLLEVRGYVHRQDYQAFLPEPVVVEFPDPAPLAGAWDPVAEAIRCVSMEATPELVRAARAYCFFCWAQSDLNRLMGILDRLDELHIVHEHSYMRPRSEWMRAPTPQELASLVGQPMPPLAVDQQRERFLKDLRALGYPNA